MGSDVLKVLCALTAFALPLGFACLIVWWQGRPRRQR